MTTSYSENWKGEPILDNYDGFIAHLKASGFTYVSEGTFRSVYERKGVVIKVPKTTDGFNDNLAEHKAYHLYFNGPTRDGIRMAPCRILPNGALMMMRLKWGKPYSVPRWADRLDGRQVGPYKGRVVAYDFGPDLSERVEWEKDWEIKSKFFAAREKYRNNQLRKKMGMNKEEMNKEIGEAITGLREHAQNITKLVDNLQMTLRGGDIAFSTVEETARILEGLKGTNPAKEVAKIHKAMKARAKARANAL